MHVVVVHFFSVSSCGVTLQEAKKGMAVAGKINVTPLEEKPVEDELLVYATKQVLTWIIQC